MPPRYDTQSTEAAARQRTAENATAVWNAAVDRSAETVESLRAKTAAERTFQSKAAKAVREHYL